MKMLQVIESDIKRVNSYMKLTNKIASKSNLPILYLWYYDGKNLMKTDMDVAVILKNVKFTNHTGPAMLNNILAVTGDKVDDYPVIQNDGKPVITGKIEMIKQAGAFALNDKHKRNINVVYFDMDNDFAVSTDAHRLVTVPLKYDIENYTCKAGDIHFLLSLDAFNFIVKCGEIFDFNIYEKTGTFENENFKIMVRLVNERYPNYLQVIPKDNLQETGITENEITKLKVLYKQIKPDSADKTPLIDFKSGVIRYTSKTLNPGKITEIKTEIKSKVPKISGVFSLPYVIDILDLLITTDTVKYLTVSGMNPGVFKTEKGIIAVIMPIRP